MGRDPYPEIGQILAASVEGPWDTIVLDAAVGGDWARFQAAAYMSNAERRGIRLIDLDRLEDLFEQVRDLTREVADAGQPDWTTARFTLRRDGQFDVDFGYGPA